MTKINSAGFIHGAELLCKKIKSKDKAILKNQESRNLIGREN